MYPRSRGDVRNVRDVCICSETGLVRAVRERGSRHARIFWMSSQVERCEWACSWCVLRHRGMSLEAHVKALPFYKTLDVPREILRDIYNEIQRVIIQRHYPFRPGRVGVALTPSDHLPPDIKTVSDIEWFSFEGLDELEHYL